MSTIIKYSNLEGYSLGLGSAHKGTPICAPSNYGGLEEVADGVPPIAKRWYGDFIGPIPNPLRPPETLSCAKAVDQNVPGNRVFEYWSI